jgi:hypothetical protein
MGSADGEQGMPTDFDRGSVIHDVPVQRQRVAHRNLEERERDKPINAGAAVRPLHHRLGPPWSEAHPAPWHHNEVLAILADVTAPGTAPFLDHCRAPRLPASASYDAVGSVFSLAVRDPHHEGSEPAQDLLVNTVKMNRFREGIEFEEMRFRHTQDVTVRSGGDKPRPWENRVCVQ